MEENKTSRLEVILSEFEKELSWKKGGDIADRLDHCLRQYRQMADNSIYQAKNFIDDVKVQFKALEIIIEGLTSDGMNHGQKRVIANHIITMLRTMVDKIDNADHTFSTNMFDRYNFFRSNTPEKRVYEERRELKRKTEAQEKLLEELKMKHPDTFTELEDQIPF